MLLSFSWKLHQTNKPDCTFVKHFLFSKSPYFLQLISTDYHGIWKGENGVKKKEKVLPNKYTVDSMLLWVYSEIWIKKAKASKFDQGILHNSLGIINKWLTVFC